MVGDAKHLPNICSNMVSVMPFEFYEGVIELGDCN